MNTTFNVVKIQSLKKGKKFHWNFTHKFQEVSIGFTKVHKVSIWHKLQSGDHWSRFCWLSRKKKCDKPLIEISKYRKCPWNLGWNFMKISKKKSQNFNVIFIESFTWNFRTLTTISQSKIAQTSPPPSINLVTVNLQYPLLPPTPKILRLRPKYGKYSKIKWRGGVMFLQPKMM